MISFFLIILVRSKLLISAVRIDLIQVNKRKNDMKKIVTFLFVASVALTLVATPVFAGGGQTTGEKGRGEVAQEGPCPFGGDTPAGPSN